MPFSENRPLPHLRLARPDDRGALYRICLETGDSGADATGLYRDPLLLGHVYAGPYLAHQPDLAFVVEDEQGVGGYVIGALDTDAFARTLEREWWPPLREQYPMPSGDSANWTPDERIQALIHRPPRTPEDITARFPSHLHIDLLPRMQGGGNGRRLMMALWAALREQGSPGVHLGVGARNTRAVGFYHHLGFHTLREDPYSLTLGLPLQS
ncbi:putative GCN5-related N-acetyltransferase [Deinococcus aerius]|uniref:Putative GCN5-related N-acetyltransferase n=1 Tax=Deinococcus aerius TaxID=200253 RepID=A0A2I9DMG5_9DEIO|nr:GNAT family N-acetyltransferase [Deinococcus aerius]GBF06201.1 putative GCN5-related N-acetyltransferase [Deinococcus aerius]